MKYFLSILLVLSCSVASQAIAQSDSISEGWQVINLKTDAFLGQVCFASRDTVVAGGQTVIRSTDGGLTWAEWRTPTTIGAPHFDTPRFGYVQAQGDSIFRTTDGGEYWDTLHSHVPSFTSDFEVVTPAFLICTSLSWVGRSTDSGNSWQVQELNTPSLNAISFADSLNGYVVGDFQSGPHGGQLGAGCFRTSNGGVGWTQTYTAYDGDLRACFAVTAQKIYAAGSKGIIFSSNGGETWTLQNPVGGVINAMTFASPLHGIAIGNGGLVMTTYDGGETWWRQPTPTAAGLYSVAFFNDSLGIIGGVNGTLLRTTNGGNAGVSTRGHLAPLSMSLHPNPASNIVTISYTLPRAQHVTLTIVSSIGETVMTLLDGSAQNEGERTIEFDTSALTNGSYLYHLETESYEQAGRFTVLH